MTLTEKKVWLDQENVFEQFLENVKSPEWEKTGLENGRQFQKLKCSMSLKLHFKDFHVEDFPENLGDYSEEEGERSH